MFCYRTPTNDCFYITTVHESCSKLKKRHSEAFFKRSVWKFLENIDILYFNNSMVDFLHIFNCCVLIRDEMWMSRNLKLVRVPAIFDGNFSLLCFVCSKQNSFVSLPSKHLPEKNGWNMVKVNKKKTPERRQVFFSQLLITLLLCTLF